MVVFKMQSTSRRGLGAPDDIAGLWDKAGKGDWRFKKTNRRFSFGWIRNEQRFSASASGSIWDVVG
jgi:hypothetical protein